MIAVNWCYHKCVEMDRPFFRDACFGWFLYLAVSFIEDIVSFIILFTLRIKLATNFDSPWMATTITELWARRFNMVFAQTLRDFIFHPICEGKNRSQRTSSKTILQDLGSAVKSILTNHVPLLGEKLWQYLRHLLPVDYFIASEYGSPFQ